MPDKNWFKRSFGEDYLKIYTHRNNAQAKDNVAFAESVMGWSAGDCLLDLACGAGRHLMSMKVSGMQVYGMDLSALLLEHYVSQTTEPADAAVVRGDMRALPFAPVFDHVTMFFSSLGYFDESHNKDVLAGIAAILKPGGKLFLDLMNKAYIEQNLVPHSVEIIDGWTVESNRCFKNNRVEKNMVMTCAGDSREYHESVYMYSLEELQTELAHCELDVKQSWGDYAANPFEPAYPRMIVLAEKRAT